MCVKYIINWTLIIVLINIIVSNQAVCNTKGGYIYASLRDRLPSVIDTDTTVSSATFTEHSAELKAAELFLGYMYRLSKANEIYCSSIGVDITPYISTFKGSHSQLIKSAREVIDYNRISEEEYWERSKLILLDAEEYSISQVSESLRISNKQYCSNLNRQLWIVASMREFRKASEVSYKILMGRIFGSHTIDQKVEEAYRQGIVAYKNDDYNKAIEIFQPLADSGYHKAQYSIGFMYYYGKAFQKNYNSSVIWYHKAALQGNEAAQLHLGNAYLTGQGVAKDFSKALDWYQKAAIQGSPKAQENLGLMYAHAVGINKDEKQAFIWFRAAADGGNLPAMVNLGNTYASGKGIDQNYHEARRWYRIAAKRGQPVAAYNLGVLYYTGLGVDKDYTLAAHWYRKAADSGYSLAQLNLGYMYKNGIGVAKDLKKAARLYSAASAQGIKSMFDDTPRIRDITPSVFPN
ncbi:MAG: SEL1-like repeat protein [Candidatus Thiodiazotropha sp.]